MQCEICKKEIPLSQQAEGEDRDYIICKFCGVVLCEECCLSPETGYCNRHLHHFYNFPDCEIERLQKAR